MFGTVKKDENAPVKVEQISAGFYIMHPSPAYHPIYQGDAFSQGVAPMLLTTRLSDLNA